MDYTVSFTRLKEIKEKTFQWIQTSMYTVMPVNLASKNVGKFTPEIYWHPFNLANCSENLFQTLGAQYMP